MLVTGVMLGLFAYGLYVAYRCTFRVEEGYVAVLVAFGRAETTDGKHALVTYGPGMHSKKPWQKVVTVSMKEQNLDLHGEDGGGMAMADDGTVLRLDAFVRYVPVKEVLYEHLFGIERPLEHITGLFTCLLRNEIANFRGTQGSNEPALSTRFDFAVQAGSYALIRRERRLLNERIQAFCHAKIDNRYGVRFNAVDLADILPPDELADALNAVMQAQSESEGLLFRAEGECQQRILASEQGVRIAETRASAVEIEIRTLAGYLGELEKNGVLGAYLARRQSEVTSESRALFLKEGTS